jgi:hypothetical protein
MVVGDLVCGDGWGRGRGVVSWGKRLFVLGLLGREG